MGFHSRRRRFLLCSRASRPSSSPPTASMLTLTPLLLYVMCALAPSALSSSVARVLAPGKGMAMEYEIPPSTKDQR